MDRKSGNYNKYTSKNPFIHHVTAAFLNQAISLAESVNAKTILDAGRGEGFVLSYIGDRAVGLDISSKALSIAGQKNPGVTLCRGSICNIPFKSSSFDLVLAMEVLEHLERPDRALGEVERVSKEFIIFSVPNEPY